MASEEPAFLPSESSVSSAGGGDDDSNESFLRAVAQASDRPLPAREVDRTGARIGKYRVLERLGAGGMGIVYRAEDDSLGRLVALKVLKRRQDEDDAQRRRFVREARAASAVRHPNVAAVYEVGEHENEAFIAMELVPGTSLRERIEEGPIEIREAVRITIEIARALGAAHAKNIVHRDLKPDNVILEPDGRVKVLDFGLARWLDPNPAAGASETLTVEGHILGTPGYMSPEQARGVRADARSDVFSLGVVLFELVTGRRPFVGETRVDVIVATSRDPAPDLISLRPEAPRSLARLAQSMLEKTPDLRPGSVSEVEAALESVLSERPAPRRWRVAAAASAAILGAGVVAFATSSKDDESVRIDPATPPAAASASGAPTAETLPATTTGAAPPAATSAPLASATPTASAGTPPASRPSVAPKREPAPPPPSAKKPDPLGDQK